MSNWRAFGGSWRSTRSARSGRGVPLATLAALVILLLGVGLPLDGAHAASSFVVDTTTDATDVLPGDGACLTAGNQCTLRAAIQEANALPGADAISLPSGVYELAIAPLNQNDITTGDLDITESLTITGAGAGSTIVDGGDPKAGSPVQVRGLDRLLEIHANNAVVGISGVTIRDGYAQEYGGGILNAGNAAITVSDVVMTGNFAGKTGGALDNHAGGSVVVTDSDISGNAATESGSALNNNRNGSLVVTDSTISANAGSAVGLDETLMGAGAISNNAELDTAGTIAVSGSDITGNIAGGGRSGAAISNDGTGSVTVDHTTFSKNRTSGNGGAIFNGTGDVAVADSAFSENQADDGGAVYNTGLGSVTVDRSNFSLNWASASGGAIATGGSGVLSVADSIFSKNRADDSGGAVSNADKGSVGIRNSSFTENSGLNGGGFSNEGAGLVTVGNATFTKNLAPAGEGGGIHSNSSGEVVITNGAFSENKALSGGGLANEGGGQVTITSTRFSVNTADEQGGGILVQSGAVRMVDIDVIGNVANSALEGGGGISYVGDKSVSIGESATIENSRIRDNKSSGDGGGIDSRGDGTLAITTTVIAGNIALAGGAIHHVGDAPLLVTRSTLSGNSADSGGAVFADGDGEATLENTTVSGNRAGQFGGGLLVSSRLTISSSTVTSNSAPFGGGVNNGGGDLVGDGLVFLGNTIVAGNPTGGNCSGTITSLGGNIDNLDTCAFRELTDQSGTDPLLGPLADNGGPTQTHALSAGSPAQDAAVCASSPCPPLDQRGVARPHGVGFDIGAYESELPPEAPPNPTCAGRSERTLRASADSWLAQGAPGNNFGSDSILKVKSQRGSANARMLVRFDLPQAPPGCALIGATLRLHSSSATSGRTLQAAKVASSWTESGVTWANQPATAGSVAKTTSGLGYREWNVTGQTQEMYSPGANHGFLIRDAAENGTGFEQSFHSREKGTDAPPELVLIFDSPTGGDPVCPSSAQTLLADADTWVNQGSPSNNLGTDSTLKVKSQSGGNNSRSLVRFPLPDLPEGCTGVASATLRLHAGSAKSGRTLQAVRIASSWTETGATWSNQPGVAGAAATAPSGLGVIEWSVTDQVRGMYSAGNHGFLIRDAAENGAGDEQAFNSREKSPDNPPTLVITFQ